MASQWPPKKNAEFTLEFTLYKNDGSVIANPGAITKKISKDGGGTADITAAITEIDTTYGHCSVVLSATEMNADRVWIYIADNTTGCVPFTCTVYTAANTQDEVKAAIPTATDNADALLKRDWTEVSGEAARSALNAFRFLRNKWSILGTTLTVTKENDSTSAWTATLTTNASAEAVTGSDPG